MKLEDFNNIDFKNAGSLPVPVKAVLLSALFLILLALGYYFLWSPAIESLDAAKAKEQVDELDALFGVGAFAPPSEFKGAEFRQWIDNSGAYQVKARLAVIYVDKVKLLKENGKFTTVPLSRLSDADFGYVSWVATNLTTEQTARMVKTESQSTESDVSR